MRAPTARPGHSVQLRGTERRHGIPAPNSGEYCQPAYRPACPPAVCFTCRPLAPGGGSPRAAACSYRSCSESWQSGGRVCLGRVSCVCNPGAGPYRQRSAWLLRAERPDAPLGSSDSSWPSAACQSSSQCNASPGRQRPASSAMRTADEVRESCVMWSCWSSNRTVRPLPGGDRLPLPLALPPAAAALPEAPAPPPAGVPGGEAALPPLPRLASTGTKGLPAPPLVTSAAGLPFAACACWEAAPAVVGPSISCSACRAASAASWHSRVVPAAGRETDGFNNKQRWQRRRGRH